MSVISVFIAAVLLAGPAWAANAGLPAIANPGFEEVAAGNDAPGWAWYVRTAKAGFRSETSDPHSGSRCMLFWDESELAPEVYGRLHQEIDVLPGTQYELTVWARGEGVGPGLHFTDWQCYTLNIPAGTYGWRKLTTRFRTGDTQSRLDIGINVVNICKALAIDDISLMPVGDPIEGKGVTGSIVVPAVVKGHNVNSQLRVLLTSGLTDPAAIDASISAGKTELFKASEPIEPGENQFAWEWNTGTCPDRALRCSIRVRDAKGNVLASVDKQIEKLTPDSLVAEIDRIESRLKEFDDLYAKCSARKIPLDYEDGARVMFEQFIPYAREDAANGEEVFAGYAVKDFDRSLDDSISRMRAYLKETSLAPNAKRYRTGRVEIDGSSFLGDWSDSRGSKGRGPVFFCGVGHFSQIRKDMARFPRYGMNIVQVEVGPSVTFPKEDETSLDALNEVAALLDNAAKQNVMVNVLLSPHYFPGWAMQKWQHLGKGGGGFLGYCVDEPEAKQIIEKFLRLAVPILKDKPALSSFCLSNEPIFDRSAACDNTNAMWAAYLARAHGDIGVLNRHYGASYASFDAVPIPATWDSPQFYDWCVFTQERFAGWHKWMADIIHEMAPRVPVHAKTMPVALTERSQATWGVDHERMCELSDINGNDCWDFPAGSGWASGWATQNIYYDLQRSVARHPIFNSENHITPDGGTRYVPPEHFRCALWQGAIHGQGATTIWVWERTRGQQREPSFYGNLMDRPGCAQAVGATCLDLNRFADEVTALQNVGAPVAILRSMASLAKSDHYGDALNRAYTALNFCGVKIDFITEKQLAAGKGKRYKMIVIPAADHLPDPAFRALRDLSGSTRLVVLGYARSARSGPALRAAYALRFDPYGARRLETQVAEVTKGALQLARDADVETVLWPALRDELKRLGILPEIQVVDAATGRPVWGVEWLPARVGGKTVVNIVNLRSEPLTVRVLWRGKPAKAVNLLSVGGREAVESLKPETPVLAEVKM